MFMNRRIMVAAILAAVPILTLVGDRVTATTQAAPVKAGSAHILVSSQG